MPLPDPFPVARYRLEFQVERPLALPDFAGSTLRGVFGHALRDLACATGLPECRSCPLWRRCAYPAVFETPPPLNTRRVYSDIPQPYVVEPPTSSATAPLRPGEMFSFAIVLIGPALGHLPLVLLAWQRALAAGVGAGNRGSARLLRVWLDGDATVPVLPSPVGHIRPHRAEVSCAPGQTAVSDAVIELITPLRIKRNGHEIRPHEPFTPADFLGALVRRIADLCDLQLGRPAGFDFSALRKAAEAVQGDSAVRWHEAERWSNRQGRATPMGGLVGHIGLHGDLQAFWPLLHLGQWLHVGGKATLGLGAYRVLPARPPGIPSLPYLTEEPS